MADVLPIRPEEDPKLNLLTPRYLEIVALNVCAVAVAGVSIWYSHQQWPIWVVVAAFVMTGVTHRVSWRTLVFVPTLVIYTALAILATLYLRSYEWPMVGLAIIAAISAVAKRQSGDGF